MDGLKDGQGKLLRSYAPKSFFLFRKQLDVHAVQQKVWDESLAPHQPGEDTPQSQAIVDR